MKKHIPFLTGVQELEITPRYTGVQHNESVSSPFFVEKTTTADGPLVYFGPIDPESQRQLAIPATFERLVQDVEQNLSVTLSCVFKESRVEVCKLIVSADIEGHISSRAISQLGLPSLIREVSKAVIPNWEFWGLDQTEVLVRNVNKDNYAYLAQIYWLEYISHGAPRQTLMSLLGMPRSTCNVLLRNIRKHFEMPKVD